MCVIACVRIPCVCNITIPYLTQVSFDQCTIRTAEDHDQSCVLIETAPDSNFHSTTYGINYNSPLNNLQYQYHVTNFGLPPDPILEGYTN